MTSWIFRLLRTVRNCTNCINNFEDHSLLDTVSMLSKLKYETEFCFFLSFNLNCHITHNCLQEGGRKSLVTVTLQLCKHSLDSILDRNSSKQSWIISLEIIKMKYYNFLNMSTKLTLRGVEMYPRKADELLWVTVLTQNFRPEKNDIVCLILQLCCRS